MNLIKMAVEQINKNNQNNLTLLALLSENLNDIQLYLDNNKSNLSEIGEVDIPKLFMLMKKNRGYLDSIKIKMEDSNSWENAILGDN